MITKAAILDKTHYGLKIYAYVLRQFYNDSTVLSLHGRVCDVTKNPFNNNKTTLLIEIVTNVAIYKDIEIETFKGDAFDFANLYFKKDNMKCLFEAINEALHLRLKQNHSKVVEYIDNTDNTWDINCSYFKGPITNVFPSKSLRMSEIYDLIVGQSFKNITKELRQISDSKEAKKYKAKHFDYVTFSGTFKKRSDQDLIKHAQLIVIDFDHLENINQTKAQLMADDYFETELLFVSPSGDGLKWIIKIDLREVTHQEYFLAVSNYIQKTYHLKVDPSGKDISRACFLSHDPEAFINPKHLIK